MCHSSLQIELGDWVNFITGQNGSKPFSFSRYVDACDSIGSVKFMHNESNSLSYVDYLVHK